MINFIGLVGFLLCFSLSGAEHVYLTTPAISKQAVIGTNVGVRPYRKTGVRLEAQYLNDKYIIHNYGYGGSGITLSFGGAKEVLDVLESQPTSSKTVAVLGAGVIGLTTAYVLLEQGYTVHLYADQWSPYVTSDVAAGIWSPLTFPLDMPENKKVLHKRMLDNAEKRFLKSIGDNPEFQGVRMIDSYSFKIKDSQEAIATKHNGEEVIVHFDNGVIKHGRRVYELGIDNKIFMKDLRDKVQSKGAILKKQFFTNIQDVIDLDEPIIINCMSLGSRTIFNDQEFILVRGQLVYFPHQDGVDYLLYQNIPGDTTAWVSIYPWNDRLILGGVYEYGQENPVVDQQTIDKIIDNAEKCLSSNV